MIMFVSQELFVFGPVFIKISVINGLDLKPSFLVPPQQGLVKKPDMILCQNSVGFKIIVVMSFRNGS